MGFLYEQSNFAHYAWKELFANKIFPARQLIHAEIPPRSGIILSREN